MACLSCSSVVPAAVRVRPSSCTSTTVARRGALRTTLLRSRPVFTPRPRRAAALTSSTRAALPTEVEVFNFENVAILPFWLSMVVVPKLDLTKKVMSSYSIFYVLGAIYLYLAYVSLSEPAILEGFSNSQDLSALTAAFSYEKTVAVGWAHFIAADLFAGRWVYLDGLRNKVFTRHSLLLCLFFGPTGVVSHLLTRAVTGAVRGEKLEDIMLAGADKDL